MDAEEKLKILSNTVSQLMEHFDSVQIIVTTAVPDSDATGFASWGGGNWYARYGSVREWLIQQEQLSRKAASN